MGKLSSYEKTAEPKQKLSLLVLCVISYRLRILLAWKPWLCPFCIEFQSLYSCHKVHQAKMVLKVLRERVEKWDCQVLKEIREAKEIQDPGELLGQQVKQVLAELLVEKELRVLKDPLVQLESLAHAQAHVDQQRWQLQTHVSVHENIFYMNFIEAYPCD